MKNTFLFFILATSLSGILAEQQPENPFKRQILYTPLRASYIKNSEEKKEDKNNECIFCHQLKENDDKKNILLARFKYTAVWLNLYPYNKGHLLIMPKRHVKNLDDLTRQEKAEIFEIIVQTPKILEEALGAEGANIGINIGKIASSSKPDHVHIHVIPRYSSTNSNRLRLGFLQTTGETQIVQWDMDNLYDLLKVKFEALRLQIDLA